MTTAPTLHDVLIIGSGAAGLSLALRLADRIPVTVLSKVALNEGSTLYAQGGISAVLHEKDSIESHIQDTLVAGAGLCDPEAVRLVVSQGKDCIDWLLERGVPFTEETWEDGSSHLHLTREGGHSHRRVVHAADATGKAIETSLEKHARNHPNIDLLEFHNVVDLITDRKTGGATTACTGCLCARHPCAQGGYITRTYRRAGHRRCQQGLSVHQQSGCLHRRRHGFGVAGGGTGGQHGVHPIPSHLPIPSPCPLFLDQRGSPRRGWQTAVARRHLLHGQIRPAQGTGAPRHRRPRHRP